MCRLVLHTLYLSVTLQCTLVWNTLTKKFEQQKDLGWKRFVTTHLVGDTEVVNFIHNPKGKRFYHTLKSDHEVACQVLKAFPKTIFTAAEIQANLVLQNFVIVYKKLEEVWLVTKLQAENGGRRDWVVVNKFLYRDNAEQKSQDIAHAMTDAKAAKQTYVVLNTEVDTKTIALIAHITGPHPRGGKPQVPQGPFLGECFTCGKRGHYLCCPV